MVQLAATGPRDGLPESEGAGDPWRSRKGRRCGGYMEATAVASLCHGAPTDRCEWWPSRVAAVVTTNK